MNPATIARVYRYGLRRCLSGQTYLEAEISRAHGYYNRLIRRERDRREQIHALAGEPTDPTRLAAVARLTAESQDARRRERAALDTPWWGTYLLVEAAVAAACRRPAPPQYEPWRDGAGRVGVQFQQGRSPASIWAENTVLQVRWREAPLSRRHCPSEGRGRVTVSLRVGMTEDGQPIMVTYDAIWHRPIPSTATLKAAMIVRQCIPGRSGPGRYRDELHVIVDEPAAACGAGVSRIFAIAIPPAPGETAILTTGGRWESDAGSAATLAAARGLRAVREQISRELVRALHACGLSWPATWPEQIRMKLETLPHWKSSYRLRALYALWTSARFPADDDGYAILDRWWRGDGVEDHGERHRWEYESALWRQLVARRTDSYRRHAAAWLPDGSMALVLPLLPTVRRSAETGQEAWDQLRRILIVRAWRVGAPIYEVAGRDVEALTAAYADGIGRAVRQPLRTPGGAWAARKAKKRDRSQEPAQLIEREGDGDAAIAAVAQDRRS